VLIVPKFIRKIQTECPTPNTEHRISK